MVYRSRKAMSLPDSKERLFAQGVEAIGTMTEEFARIIRRDLAKYARIVKEGKIPLE